MMSEFISEMLFFFLNPFQKGCIYGLNRAQKIGLGGICFSLFCFLTNFQEVQVGFGQTGRYLLGMGVYACFGSRG